MPASLQLVPSNDAVRRNNELVRLLAACARGDERALQRLYDATASHTYGRLMRMLRNEALAEDALQDVYVRVWRSAGRFESSRGSVGAWIGGIARNRALDIIQQRGREVPLEEAGDLDQWFDAAPPPDLEVAGLQDAAALRRCLDALGTDARAAVQRAYFDGLSYAEVAAAMGRPLGTMKSIIRRSLLALRACLES
jgi:RNA polymerase sigma-70 factor (ECF subfamily)